MKIMLFLHGFENETSMEVFLTYIINDSGYIISSESVNTIGRSGIGISSARRDSVMGWMHYI